MSLHLSFEPLVYGRPEEVAGPVEHPQHEWVEYEAEEFVGEPHQPRDLMGLLLATFELLGGDAALWCPLLGCCLVLLFRHYLLLFV